MRPYKAARVTWMMAGAVALAAANANATGLSYSLSPNSINGTAVSGFNQVLASNGQIIGYDIGVSSDGLFDAQFSLTSAAGTLSTPAIQANLNFFGSSATTAGVTALRTTLETAPDPLQPTKTVPLAVVGSNLAATANLTVTGVGNVSLTPRADRFGGVWMDGSTVKTGSTGTITGASSSVIGGATPVVTGNAVVVGGYSATSLTVNSGAKLTAKGAAVTTSSLVNNGTLDLTNQSLVVNYSGTSPVGTIIGQVTGGRITSSSGASGYAMGVTDSGTAVTVKNARLGDADLSGAVDFSDLGLLLQNYGKPSTGAMWGLGDFDYSSAVDFSDLGFLLQNYGQLAGGTVSGVGLDA